MKENKHLPEIETSEKIQEKGLNLGEMQSKLLKKVEELTLYVIEQKKEIERLKNKIESSEK